MSEVATPTPVGLPRDASSTVGVSVVVPTYREAENLPELACRVDAAMTRLQRPYELIIVDDNSLDDTIAVCSQLSENVPLKLLTRKQERGLASAVIFGCRGALGSVLVVMDADLSHPPESIPDLVRVIEQGEADIAVGSRYAPGGGVEEDWPLVRRVISAGATALASPLGKVSDPMSGFFALSRQGFLEVSNDLNPLGYKILLELIVKMNRPKIAEMPILFHERKRGKSKLDLKEHVSYLRHLGRLYGHRLRQRLGA